MPSNFLKLIQADEKAYKLLEDILEVFTHQMVTDEEDIP